MIAVIFEVLPKPGHSGPYFDIAAELAPLLSDVQGFVSIERFQSLANPQKYLSLSYWENEEAVAAWRNLEKHRSAQSEGRSALFEDYRLRVASVLRDYSMHKRGEEPCDSRRHHSTPG